MSTATEYSYATTHEAEIAPYRAVCRSAVISLALAVISLPLVAMAAYSVTFKIGDAVFPGSIGALWAVPALILGLTGWLTVRRYPQEYTGGKLALAGLVGGALLMLTGASVAAYDYATEVPEGYDRVGFWELQPDPEHPELPISPKALEVSGKPIFIKGYMHPGVASSGKVNRFILVPDMGTCCFGGQPKPTDMIAVYVPPGRERVAYSRRYLKLAGTFALADQPTQSLGLSNVWYHLQLDQVK